MLCEEHKTIIQQILSQLENEDYKVTKCGLSDIAPAEQNVLSLLDTERPFFETIDKGRFLIFKDFFHNLKDAELLWLTHLS